jgi:sarcosine oxidase subunit beta
MPILLDRSELRRHLPDVGPTFSGGLRDPSAGHVDQRKATAYFAHVARSKGAVVLEHVAVREIERGESGFRIITETNEMRGASVVIAAGVWSSSLAAQLGLILPIAVRRNHALRSAPVRAVTDAVIVAPQPETGHVVIRQLRDGGLTMSGFRRTEWVDVRVADGLNQAASRETFEAATRVLPLLSSTPILARWSGLNDVTPDEVPFLGADPRVPGLFIATGFSGHGFAIAPAVGAALGELIARGDKRHDLGAFSVDRFAGVDTAAALSRLTGIPSAGLLQPGPRGG